MKNLIVIFALFLSMQTFLTAQTVGGRLEIGQTYTFESVSGPGMFISYGATPGRAGLNAANRKFKVVAPLNGKAGFVSLQAADIAGTAYLVMAEGCPRPYTASNYYNVTVPTAITDATFNNNASFEVLGGNSNKQDANLISFRVKNGTHFLKREQGVFMNAPGGGAPQYQTHLTWKIEKKSTSPSIVSDWTFDTGGNGIATITFNADKSGKLEMGGNSEVFTYEMPDATTLSINVNGNVETNKIISLNATTMVIQDQNNTTITLTRK